MTQPRVTCYRVGIRMNEPQMAALLVSHGRPGFYFRVIEEGEIEAGDEIVQVTRGSRAYDRRGDECAVVHARSFKEPAGAGCADPGPERRLAQLLQALLDRERSGGAVTGNPGLTPAAGPPPAWTGSARCGYRASTVKAPA